MNDYSDLLYTIMSVVIFSFLLLQANSLILRNDAVTVNHEFEKTAIGVAQSIIDEAKTRAFDPDMSPGSIPDGFRPPGQMGWNGTTPRDQFTSFDDYHDYTEIVQTQLGNYEVSVFVEYVENESPFAVSGTQTVSKRMTVQATSDDNNESATLVYIKSYLPGL